MRSLAERFDEPVRDWDVSVENTLATETSLLAFGTRRGQAVVLKVARREGEEWRSGEIVGAFEGRGMVRALEHAEGTVLLQRIILTATEPSNGRSR